MGIRVWGQAQGSSYTFHLSREGIEKMVRPRSNWRNYDRDPTQDCRMLTELGQLRASEFIRSSVVQLDTDWKIAQARRAEEVAPGCRPRILNPKARGSILYMGHWTFANSRGFAGSYRPRAAVISAVPVAKQTGSMEKDYWHSASAT